MVALNVRELTEELLCVLLKASWAPIFYLWLFPLILGQPLGILVLSFPVFPHLFFRTGSLFLWLLLECWQERSPSWHYLRIWLAFFHPFSSCLCVALLATSPSFRTAVSPGWRQIYTCLQVFSLCFLLTGGHPIWYLSRTLPLLLYRINCAGYF